MVTLSLSHTHTHIMFPKFFCKFSYRLRPESCIASASKACREKLRRDWLNERHAIVRYIFLLSVLRILILTLNLV